MALSPWPSSTATVALAAATTALRAALGETDATDEKIQRLGAAVAAHVERFAPDAPQATKDEAVIRASGWLLDTIGAQRFRGVGALDLEPAPVQSGPWFRSSGAMALLSPWKVRRAGVVG